MTTNSNVINNKCEIEGLIVRDSKEWKDEFAKDIATSKFGILWKHQLSDFEVVTKKLRTCLKLNNGFWFYHIASNVTNCRFHVIDFAVAKDYNEVKLEWENKYHPCWYKDSFADYNDGKKYAKIVFLVDQFEWIDRSECLFANQFQTFNNKQASRQNVVAYEFINY